MKRKWNPWIYIKNFRFNSLFLNNFLLLLCVILIPIWIFCFLGFYYYHHSYSNEMNQLANDDLERVQEAIDTMTLNVQLLASSLSTNADVNDIITMEKGDRISYENGISVQNLTKNMLLMTNGYIESIYIYSYRNHYVVSTDLTANRNIFYDNQWIEELEENTDYGRIHTWGRRKLLQTFETPGKRKTSPCITTAMRILTKNTKKAAGYVAVNIDNRWIDEVLSRKQAGVREFYIVDSVGKIVYCREAEQIGASLNSIYSEADFMDAREKGHGSMYRFQNNQERYYLNYADSAKMDWSYVYISSLQEYDERMHNLRLVLLTVAVSLTIAAMVVAYFVSIKVFLPLKNIIDLIDDPAEFYEMNAKDTADRHSSNELKYITTAFMNHVNQYEQNKEEMTGYVTRLKETQVALLQTQINPHFLFNTLQTINFMAIRMTKSDNDISRGIGMLSTMLRNIMDIDNHLFSVRQELEYCKNYIQLECLRYYDEFTVQWDVEEDILEYRTVKMILQPMLENCIRHGFGEKTENGRIVVEAKRQEEKLYFTVTDNGKGQTAEWIWSMNTELENFDSFVGKHIGIRNVNQRIKLLFGVNYGVRVYEVSKGFSIGLVIPVIQEE